MTPSPGADDKPLDWPWIAVLVAAVVLLAFAAGTASRKQPPDAGKPYEPDPAPAVTSRNYTDDSVLIRGGWRAGGERFSHVYYGHPALPLLPDGGAAPVQFRDMNGVPQLTVHFPPDGGRPFCEAP